MTMLERLEAVRDAIAEDHLPYGTEINELEGEILIKMPMEDHKNVRDKKTGPVLVAARRASEAGKFLLVGARASKQGMTLIVGPA